MELYDTHNRDRMEGGGRRKNEAENGDVAAPAKAEEKKSARKLTRQIRVGEESD